MDRHGRVLTPELRGCETSQLTFNSAHTRLCSALAHAGLALNDLLRAAVVFIATFCIVVAGELAELDSQMQPKVRR